MEKEKACQIDRIANSDLILPQNYKFSIWGAIKKKFNDFLTLIILILLVYLLFCINYILLHLVP